jgi:hypothetical protein
MTDTTAPNPTSNAVANPSMHKRILFHGLIAGLIVGGILFGTTVAHGGHGESLTLGMVIGYTSMLIALSLVFVGVKRYRDHALGGVIRFLPAFGMGLGISLVASVCYVLAWEAALAFTGMDFAGDYAKILIEQQRAKGASPTDLAKLTAEMDEFKTQYANPLYRLPMTFTEIFPVGVLVSLISAALLRKRTFLAVRR